MKRIIILVPNGENNLSSIVGAYKIFKRANAYWQEKHQQVKYQVELAGSSEEIGFHDGLFTAKPHTLLPDVPEASLVIIPSLNHRFQEALACNRAMIDWIAEQYRHGAELASVCTGAFMLAATGLLKGRSCSTHWAFANPFRKMFPDVKLAADRLITDEKGIYTNGGAYSFLNLVIYLVEKYFDRETAILCAKVFQIEPDRQRQSEFMIFRGQKEHADDEIREAQLFIENNLCEKISVQDLSEKLLMGRRNFDRRFFKATGNTPLEYLQRVRIEAAKKMLETSRKTISETMYDVGYADIKSFREIFRKITGMSPLAYRERYNKEAAV